MEYEHTKIVTNVHEFSFTDDEVRQMQRNFYNLFLCGHITRPKNPVLMEFSDQLDLAVQDL